MKSMTRRDRIRKTLSSERADRPPMSFWRHFYDRESTAAAGFVPLVQWATCR